jgi:hypothetical protein
MMAAVFWQFAHSPTMLPSMTEVAAAFGSIFNHTSPIWNGPGANGQGLCEFASLDGQWTNHKQSLAGRHAMEWHSNPSSLRIHPCYLMP